jgi:hypothetical protein
MSNYTIKARFDAIVSSVFSEILNYATTPEELEMQSCALLSIDDIKRAFAASNCDFGNTHNAIYTPELVFFVLLLQMLADKTGRSYRNTVKVVCDLLNTEGNGIEVSSNTSAFTIAKRKIKEKVPLIVLRLLAERAEAAAPDASLHLNRRNIFLVDGTTFDMFDSEANQKVYPQPKEQKKGCGFPKMRATILTSLATGMVCDIETAAYSGKTTGELSLFRKMSDRIPAGSTIVGDRLYSAYFILASTKLSEANYDAVIRLTTLREVELESTKVEKLDNGDWVISWDRPVKPEWMSQEEYETYDEQIKLRLIEAKINQKGQRTKTIYIITTLMDIVMNPTEEIIDLYLRRWNVELDFRSIKTAMGLELLRCKSPHMVRLELFFGILAYNFVRALALRCATKYKIKPRRISFTATMTTLLAFYQVARLAKNNKTFIIKQTQIDLKSLIKNIPKENKEKRQNEPRRNYHKELT